MRPTRCGRPVRLAKTRVSVPGEALVCAHNGRRRRMRDHAPAGQPAPPVSSGSSTGGSVIESAPYTGPYAVVADVSGIREGHVYLAGRPPVCSPGR